MPTGTSGGDTRGDEALPEHALLLDAHERLVQVGDVHAGTHVLAGELLAAGGGCRRTSSAIAARCRWPR